MNRTTTNVLELAARALLVAIFLLSVGNKIANFDGMTQYMASKGMFATSFFLLGAIGLLVTGGLSILTGFYARVGAVLLTVFLVPATLIFHNFWAISDAQLAQMEMLNFLKNLSILGGLLFITAHGVRGWRLDAWLARKAATPQVA